GPELAGPVRWVIGPGWALQRVRSCDSAVVNGQMPAWRSRLVLILLLAGFLALTAKAVHVQAISTEFLQEQGERRYERTLTLPATRGKIFDRTGTVVLASSIPVRAIWAIPEDARKATDGQLEAMGKLLEMSVQDIRQRITDTDSRFSYIK